MLRRTPGRLVVRGTAPHGFVLGLAGPGVFNGGYLGGLQLIPEEQAKTRATLASCLAAVFDGSSLVFVLLRALAVALGSLVTPTAVWAALCGCVGAAFWARLSAHAEPPTLPAPRTMDVADVAAMAEKALRGMGCSDAEVERHVAGAEMRFEQLVAVAVHFLRHPPSLSRAATASRERPRYLKAPAARGGEAGAPPAENRWAWETDAHGAPMMLRVVAGAERAPSRRRAGATSPREYSASSETSNGYSRKRYGLACVHNLRARCSVGVQRHSNNMRRVRAWPHRAARSAFPSVVGSAVRPRAGQRLATNRADEPPQLLCPGRLNACEGCFPGAGSPAPDTHFSQTQRPQWRQWCLRRLLVDA